ncbi:MAG: tetratricopeptide repeat protein [Bacteroidota bacterium]
MKKTIITFLAAGLLLITGLKAQTIQEGKNHLYADRFKSATGVFEKLLATNPNNIEATYWLGQTYLEMDEIAGARVATARQLYEKALLSSANAPLLLVGMGHVELRENKTSEAKQRFETALTMTRTKKGDDQTILTAIGRANAEAKVGDYNYAIEKLMAAADKGEKNPDVFLQLGNAYRKARPGEGGGDAYKSYKKALDMDPTFAVADLRLAKLFESQKNWELFLEYLNDATKRDPQFSPAYYELFYYYFFRAKFPEAEEQLKKYITSKAPETDIQDEYLYAQLCWARKDFPCAITKAEAVVSAMKDLTKPKVYRLLTDAYYQNNDFPSAKKYSDLFFAKKNPEDIILPDYENRALILSKLGSPVETVYNAYIDGVSVDTTLDAKLDFLKKGAAFFKDQKNREYEAKILEKVIAMKPTPSINDLFDLTIAYYFIPDYDKARNESNFIIQKFPDEIYGYEWAYNSAVAIALDTTRKISQDTMGFPASYKLYEFTAKDTAKYKKQYINAVRFLSAYYINEAKDKDKSLEFFRKWLVVDPANAVTIQNYIDQIEKMPAAKSGSTKKGSKPAPSAKPKTVPKVKKGTIVKK